jgi:hypothetical protein
VSEVPNITVENKETTAVIELDVTSLVDKYTYAVAALIGILGMGIYERSDFFKPDAEKEIVHKTLEDAQRVALQALQKMKVIPDPERRDDYDWEVQQAEREAWLAKLKRETLRK